MTTPPMMNTDLAFQPAPLLELVAAVLLPETLLGVGLRPSGVQRAGELNGQPCLRVGLEGADGTREGHVLLVFGEGDPRLLEAEQTGRVHPKDRLPATLGARRGALLIVEDPEAADHLPPLRLNENTHWARPAVEGALRARMAGHRIWSAWLPKVDVLETIPAADRLRALLEAELVADGRVGFSAVGSGDAKRRTPLAQVFCDLPVRVRAAADRNHPGAEEHQGDTFVRWAVGALGAPPQFASQAPAPQVTVLIGGPGQGKTTLGVYLCQLHRAALLGLAPEGVSSAGQSELKALTNQAAALRARLLPFRVVLHRFADALAQGEVPDLWSWLALDAQRRLRAAADQPALVAAEVQGWWAGRAVLLVLDGLDEVPASGNRAAVLAAIQTLLAEAEKMGAVVQVIATTRPQGYQGELSRRGATEAELVRLDAPLARTYAHKLLAVWLADDGAREHEVKARIDRALADPAAAALAVSPLQVMLVTLLVEQSGQVPRDRWRLFSEVYRLLFNRERERGIASVRVLHEHPRLVDELHEEVGYLLHLEAERASGASARLPKKAFGELVDQVLDAQGFVGEERTDVRSQVIDASMERLVFLVANEADGAISFEVRMLQEYCAARRLLSGPEDKLMGRLEAIIGLAHWHEVWGMAVNGLVAEKRHLAPEIARLAVALDRRDAPSAAARRGPRAVAALLMDPGVRAHPKLRSALVGHAVQWLRPVDPELDGDTAGALVLALLHADSRALIALIEERGRSWVLENTYWGRLFEAHVDEPEATTEPMKALLRGVARIDGHRPFRISRVGNRVDYDPTAENLPIRCWLESDEGYALPAGSEIQLRNPKKGRWLSIGQIHGSVHPIDWTLAGTGGTIYLGAVEGCRLSHEPPTWRHTTRWWLSLFWDFQRDVNLAEIAERLVERWAERPAVSELPFGTPWPLAAVFCWAGSPEELLSAVRGSNMGTRADWHAAEARWLRYGISEVDWLTPSTGLPEASLAQVGCPPWVQRLSDYEDHDGSLRSLEPKDGGVRRLDLLRGAMTMQELGIGDRLLVVYARSQGASTEFVMEWVMRRLRAPALVQVDEELEEVLDTTCWLLLLDAVGMLVDAVHRLKRGDLFVSLCDMKEAIDRAEAGAYGLLAHLAILAAHQLLLPSYAPFNIGEIGDPELRGCAIVMNVALGPGPAADRAAQAGRDLLTRSNNLDSLLASTLERWPPDAAEALLLTLLEGHDQPAPNLRRALADRLARHHTTLQDPGIAAALDLPCRAPSADALVEAPAPSADPVQLVSLKITDLRGIRSLQLTRSANADRGQWTFLIGENASGKTTVLRAIALALAGADAARALLAQHAGPPVRASCAQATVNLSLEGRPPITLTVRAPKSTDDFDAPDIFVVGYGPRRGTVLGKEARKVALEPGRSLFTLFEENAELIHAETWLTQLYSRWKADHGDERAFFDAVIKLLVELLPEVESIDVNASSVVVTERGVKVPLDAVSDGYLTTAGWLLDLIARWAERERRAKRPLTADFARRMTGLVLIDELDLHLHPRWQWGLVEALRETFPALSFFVTTHNPMTVLGAQGDEVVVLRRDGDGLTAVPVDLSAGTNAADLLTGPVFGLPSLVDRDTLRLLDQQRVLLRTAPDGEEARAVGEQLATRLGQRGPGPLEQIAQRAVADVLGEEVKALTDDQRAAARQRALARLRARSKGDV